MWMNLDGSGWIWMDLDSRWPSWDIFGVHLERLGPQGAHVGSHWAAGPIWGPRGR